MADIHLICAYHPGAPLREKLHDFRSCPTAQQALRKFAKQHYPELFEFIDHGAAISLRDTHSRPTESLAGRQQGVEGLQADTTNTNDDFYTNSSSRLAVPTVPQEYHVAPTGLISPATSFPNEDQQSSHSKGKGLATGSDKSSTEEGAKELTISTTQQRLIDLFLPTLRNTLNELRIRLISILALVKTTRPACTLKHILEAMKLINQGFTERVSDLPELARYCLEEELRRFRVEMQRLTPVAEDSSEGLVQRQVDYLLEREIGLESTSQVADIASPEPIVFEDVTLSQELHEELVNFVQTCRKEDCEPSPRGPPEPGDYKCRHCGRTFKRRDAFAKHWWAKDPFEVYRCNTCPGQIFTKGDRLTSHCRAQTGPHKMTDEEAQVELNKCRDSRSKVATRFRLRYERQCHICSDGPKFQCFKDIFNHVCSHMRQPSSRSGRKRKRQGDDMPKPIQRRDTENDDQENGNGSRLVPESSSNCRKQSSESTRTTTTRANNYDASGRGSSKQRSHITFADSIPSDDTSEGEDKDSSVEDSEAEPPIIGFSKRSRVLTDLTIYSDLEGKAEREEKLEELSVGLEGVGERFPRQEQHLAFDSIQQRQANILNGSELRARPPRTPRRSFTWPQDKQSPGMLAQFRADIEAKRQSNDESLGYNIVASGEFQISQKLGEGQDQETQSLESADRVRHLHALLDTKEHLARQILAQRLCRDKRRDVMHLKCSSPRGWQVLLHESQEVHVLEHLTKTFAERCKIERE